MRTKLLIITLLFAVSSIAFSDEFSKQEYMKMRTIYMKMMDKANPPLPIKTFSIYGKPLPDFLLLESESSDFRNVNTVDDAPNENQKMQNESSIAINPKNSLNLIASAVDYRDHSSSWVYVSNDGGHSWENINLGKPFTNWRSTNDPSVTFSDDGTAYLMYGGFEMDMNDGKFKGGNAIFISRSFDEGKTWEAHIPVVIHTAKQTLDSTFEDKYYVESDNSPTSPYYGRVYTPWKRVIARDSSTQIMFAYSEDKGASWSAPIEISPRMAYTSEDTTYGQSFPLVEAAPNGDIYAVWNNGIKHAVGFSKSTDGGDTWSEPKFIQEYNIFGITRELAQGWRHTVKGKVRAESYPVIRCDHSDSERNGYLYLTWAADSIPNIYFSRSTDGGDTWSKAKIIHSDIKNDQFWQWLAVDKINGDIGVMYFDSRRDSNNLMSECWVSYSRDGGDTWTDRPVSDMVSDLRLNPFSGNAFAGDYSGMTFHNGIMYPSWVDMRNAVKELSDSDVFTAIIDVWQTKKIEDFKVKIIPERPDALQLEWVSPTEMAFGGKVEANNYQIILLRDGEQVADFKGDINSYLDTNLEQHKLYKYEIYTSSVEHFSVSIKDENYAGGSEKPGGVDVFAISASSNNNISIDVILPKFRADSTTPMKNMKLLSIFRDNIKLKDMDISELAPEATVTFDDVVGRRGWYIYSFVVVDEFNGKQNFSDTISTQPIFAGEAILSNAKEFIDQFDVKTPNKYYLTENWERVTFINYSSSMSMGIASKDGYKPNQRDTMLIFPIDTKNEKTILDFWHICQVKKADYSYVQISNDNGTSWEDLAKYNELDYEYWQDGILEKKDWVNEKLQIEGSKENVFVRFTFKANGFKEQLGWFIDDLKIYHGDVYINDNTNINLAIYPNPADEFIFIKGGMLGQKIQLFDMFGNVIIEEIMSNYSAKINVSHITKGVYFILVDKTMRKVIII